MSWKKDENCSPECRTTDLVHHLISTNENKRKSNLYVCSTPGMFFKCVRARRHLSHSLSHGRTWAIARDREGDRSAGATSIIIINYFALSFVSSEIQLTTTSSRRESNTRMHDVYHDSQWNIRRNTIVIVLGVFVLLLFGWLLLCAVHYMIARIGLRMYECLQQAITYFFLVSFWIPYAIR